MERKTWDEICSSESYRGRWVALDSCAYDIDTGRAMEGSVVDVDDDLVELCERLRVNSLKSCAILFATA